jgi:plastocyanin
MHFVNPNSTPISPVLKLNVLYAKNVQYQAATMVSFNASIDVPPATAAGPGTQTVSGTCTAPVGSKFFAITSHTHKHATVTKVNYVSGGMVENVVDTTDWESPDVGLFYAPDFLTVKAGDTFTYSCSYSNTTSSPVLVGETAASNEMCMAIGYYFPAGTASCD